MSEASERVGAWRGGCLAVLLVLLAVSRGYHILKERNFADGAGVESEQIARNLLAGQGYSLQLSWGGARLTTAHMPPGLPLILAGLYWLPLGNPHLVFQLLQVVASGVSLILTWALARRAFSESAAWVAAVLFVLDLNLSFTVTWIQETALNMMFTLAGLWAMVRLADRPSASMAVLAGVLFGLGALVRPVVLLVFAVALVWLVVQRTAPARSLLAKGAVAVGIAGLVIAPWTIRNYAVFHRFIPIAQNWAINFWIGYNPDAAGSYVDAHGQILLPKGELGNAVRRATSEEEMDRPLSDAAWQYLQTHPIEALKLRPHCFLYFWLDHNYWLENPRYRVSRIVRAANFALVGLTALGVILNLRRPGPARLFLAVMLAVALFYTAFHADTGNRFRMQIEPLMLMFVGQLVATLAMRLRKSGRCTEPPALFAASKP